MKEGHTEESQRWDARATLCGLSISPKPLLLDTLSPLKRADKGTQEGFVFGRERIIFRKGFIPPPVGSPRLRGEPCNFFCSPVDGENLLAFFSVPPVDGGNLKEGGIAS